MALGAQKSTIIQMILRQGFKLALMGIVIGLVAAFALTRLIKSLLFGVSTTDPLVFVLVPAVIALVVLAACYIPARKATKVDPVVALRVE
jgi:ABC-type antimicrobial peptide transport system permease subunit